MTKCVFIKSFNLYWLSYLCQHDLWGYTSGYYCSAFFDSSTAFEDLIRAVLCLNQKKKSQLFSVSPNRVKVKCIS